MQILKQYFVKIIHYLLIKTYLKINILVISTAQSNKIECYFC